jgi:oligosaccharide translocation protein RFT1
VTACSETPSPASAPEPDGTHLAIIWKSLGVQWTVHDALDPESASDLSREVRQRLGGSPDGRVGHEQDPPPLSKRSGEPGPSPPSLHGWRLTARCREGAALGRARRALMSADSTAEPGGADVFSQTASAARLLLLVVLVQRAASFVLNAAVTRSVGASVLGFASNDMELLLATLLFLSREPFRLTALRLKVSSAQERQELVNVAWAPVLLGGALCVAAGVTSWTHGHWFGLSDAERVASVMFCVGALFETLGEPGYILSLSEMDFSVRAGAEGAAVISKCVLTYLLVVHLGFTVEAFGYAQALYGAVLLGMYGRWAIGHGVELPRTMGKDRGWFQGETFGTVASFLTQGLSKHLLTEGNRMMLLRATPDARGEFSVVSNYGSLVVRLVFFPLEDASRAMFAKAPSRQRAHEAFLLALRLVLTIGLIFAVFGPPYTHVLVHLVLGSRWSASAVPAVLGWYCVYIACLALNGMSESFVMATSPAWGITALNVRMALIAGVYVALVLGDPWLTGLQGLLATHGLVGLVVADCLNMALRSLSSLYQAVSEVREGEKLPLLQALPSRPALAALAMSAVAVRWSASNHTVLDHGVFELGGLARHIGVGAACGLATLAVLWTFDRATLTSAWRRLRSNKDD